VDLRDVTTGEATTESYDKLVLLPAWVVQIGGDLNSEEQLSLIFIAPLLVAVNA